MPIFFRLLHHVDPIEIVTQRILWSLLLIVTLLAARRTLGPLLVTLRDRRLVLPLAGSALMIAINWLTYVWAVNDGHVVAASLGYFLNPTRATQLNFHYYHLCKEVLNNRNY